MRQNKPKTSDFYTTFRQLWESGQEKSRVYTRNFVNEYDFGVKRATFVATLPQTLATFVATFAQKRTTMPATFATFPATMTTTLAERHSPTRSHGQHGGTTPTAQTNLHQLHRDQPPPQGHRGGARWRQAGSTPQSGNVRRATPRHKAISKAHSARRAATIYRVAPRIKTPYRCVKMANKAYNKKPPEYTGSKGKPRTA